MATETILTIRGQHNGQKPLWSDPRKEIFTTKQFRLSDINVCNRFQSLPQCNELLFELNVIHNPLFDPKKTIKAEFLTDELLKGLGKTFNVNPLHFEVLEDLIVVHHYLDYDIYEFDIKPFFKLQKKAPILFNAFLFFAKHSNIAFLDTLNTQFLNENTLDILVDFANDAETKKEKQKHKIAIESVKQTKDDLDFLLKSLPDDKYIFIRALQNYKPKNKIFIFLKEVLLEWIDLRFAFIVNYPAEHYTTHQPKNEEDENNDDDYNDDDYNDDEDISLCEIADRLVFKYNANEVVAYFIDSERQDFFNNCGTTATPCWLITKNAVELEKKENITRFSNFYDEFSTIIDLLETL